MWKQCNSSTYLQSCLSIFLLSTQADGQRAEIYSIYMKNHQVSWKIIRNRPSLGRNQTLHFGDDGHGNRWTPNLFYKVEVKIVRPDACTMDLIAKLVIEYPPENWDGTQSPKVAILSLRVIFADPFSRLQLAFKVTLEIINPDFTTQDASNLPRHVFAASQWNPRKVHFVQKTTIQSPKSDGCSTPNLFPSFDHKKCIYPSKTGGFPAPSTEALATPGVFCTLGAILRLRPCGLRGAIPSVWWSGIRCRISPFRVVDGDIWRSWL